MAKKEITYTEAMNEIEQILDRFRRANEAEAAAERSMAEA